MLLKLLPSFPSLASVSDSVRADSPFPPDAVLSLLAVANPESAQLGAWLLSATAALSLAALLKQLARKTPLEAEFLSRKEFTDFKDKDFAELRHHVDHSFQALSGKLDAINDRLFDLHSVIARVDERTQPSRRTDHE